VGTSNVNRVQSWQEGAAAAENEVGVENALSLLICSGERPGGEMLNECEDEAELGSEGNQKWHLHKKFVSIKGKIPRV